MELEKRHEIKKEIVTCPHRALEAFKKTTGG
jgi:hypothetical protein